MRKLLCVINRYKLIAVGIIPQKLQSDVIAHLNKFPSERRIIKGKSVTTHLVVYRSELNKWFKTLKTQTEELGSKANQIPVDAAIQFLQNHDICSPETLSKISKPYEYLLLLQGISEVGLANLTLTRLILQTSKSIQDLLDIEKAVQTIQEWKDDNPQYCFENCLPVSLRATIQTVSLDTVQHDIRNAISQSLQETTTQIIANESWGHDLSQIDFLPTDDQFTPEAKTLLNSLSLSVLKSPEATPSRQFLQLLVYSQGFGFGQALLLSLIPSGPSGNTLDAETLKLDASIQSPFNRFITQVRTKIDTSVGLDQNRWNAVEKRLGEQVVMIVKATDHKPLTNLQKKKIVELVNKWSTTLANICSVGTDIRLLEANDSLASILESKNDITPIKTRIRLWLITQTITALSEIGIPNDFIQDVHHINYALRLVCEHLTIDIPQEFEDPYMPAFKDRLDANKITLAKAIHRPDLMLEDVLNTQGQDKKSLVQSLRELTESQVLMPHAPDPLNEEQAQLLVGELLTIPQEIHSISLHQLHTFLMTKGLSHGLLGIAARRGDAALFSRIHQELEIPSHNHETEDAYSMTLLEYAVLGGSLEIVEQLGVEPRFIQTLLAKRAETNRPTLIALAAESGNAILLNYVIHQLDTVEPAQFNQYLTQADSEGFTPLMRAVMSKDTDCFMKIIMTLQSHISLKDLAAHINQPNANNGQAVLHLAITSHCPEIVSLAIQQGANVNLSINDLTPLHLCMLENDIHSLTHILKSPDLDITFINPNDNLIQYANSTECKQAVASALVDRLRSEDPHTQSNALTAIMNLIDRYENHQLFLQNSDLINDLIERLDSETVDIRKKAFQIIAIFSENPNNHETLSKQPRLIEKLIDLNPNYFMPFIALKD